jgi:hypothetical protein
VKAEVLTEQAEPASKFAQTVTGFLPNSIAQKMMEKAGVDRLNALYLAIDIVRRGRWDSASSPWEAAACRRTGLAAAYRKV